MINYEEGGENWCPARGRGIRGFLLELLVQSWLDQRHWNMKASMNTAHALLALTTFHELNIPATVYGVATALARSPFRCARWDAGWEIASHGLKWVEHKDMPKEEERTQIQQAIACTQRSQANGHMGGTRRCSANTVALVSEDGGFDYISDTYADDLPYWMTLEGRDQLIIPYTLMPMTCALQRPKVSIQAINFFNI